MTTSSNAQVEFGKKVECVLNGIQSLLESKNQAYNDSALNPSRIFSKSDSIEQLKVRIDDKLTRIKNQGLEDSEDTLNDLIGYLVLLKIAIEPSENQSRKFADTFNMCCTD